MGEILKRVFKSATHRNYVFFTCLIVSIILIIGACCVPPPFDVPSSILGCCGILFAYAGLWSFNIAMDKGTDAKIKHGDTEIHVINDDDTKDSGYDANLQM